MFALPWSSAAKKCGRPRISGGGGQAAIGPCCAGSPLTYCYGVASTLRRCVSTAATAADEFQFACTQVPAWALHREPRLSPLLCAAAALAPCLLRRRTGARRQPGSRYREPLDPPHRASLARPAPRPSPATPPHCPSPQRPRAHELLHVCPKHTVVAPRRPPVRPTARPPTLAASRHGVVEPAPDGPVAHRTLQNTLEQGPAEDMQVRRRSHQRRQEPAAEQSHGLYVTRASPIHPQRSAPAASLSSTLPSRPSPL